METFEVSISTVPIGFPPLVRDRLRRLGLGQHVVRGAVEKLCGGYAAANHFIDKASKEGLLVPVSWGVYQVADSDTLGILGDLPLPAHRRLVSWARTLPGLIERPVAFLAPRLWAASDLNVDEPMPVLGLRPKEATVRRPTPQWGATLFDLEPPEPWSIQAAGREVAVARVPTMLDSYILVQANADPRWRAVAARWRPKLTKTQRNHADWALSTLHRVRAPRTPLPVKIGAGPPVRKRLVTPAWYELLHQEGLEIVARGLHA